MTTPTGSTATDTDNSTKDAKFAQRLQRSMLTAQAWDDDPLLLMEIRALLPWEDLRSEYHPYHNNSPYAEAKDYQRFPNSSNLRFLQRLARFFQRDFMTWVNTPPCSHCDGHEISSNKNNGNDTPKMTYIETRGPTTEEERSGDAARVEVYQCPNCHKTTSFPRYNAIRAILEHRQGRCGEYANLFGAVCRAVGCETRYVVDWTDHVWTEVRVLDEWIMVDSCEGVVNEPSMYEAGWGKKLNYVVAFAADHCIDVTWRYTRQAQDVLNRRRQYTSSETACDAIIQQACQRLVGGINNTKARKDLEQRLGREMAQLNRSRDTTTWDNVYAQGRLSGSLEWKQTRAETGNTALQSINGSNNESTGNDPPLLDGQGARTAGYTIETFLPLSLSDVFISVQPFPQTPQAAILVSGTAAAVGQQGTLSVVVVDPRCVGCVLQSRGLASFEDLVDFVETIPPQRIVAIHGQLEQQKVQDNAFSRITEMLPSFRSGVVMENGMMFLGQKDAAPDWAFCASFRECPSGYRVTMKGPRRDVSLKTLRHMQPTGIMGRVSGDWTNATESEKRQAFLSCKNLKSSGYCTKPGMPIYLLSESAYPLQPVKDEEAGWNTFLWWPTPMVPESDHGIVESPAMNSSPVFQVPLNLGFFEGLLGSTLQTSFGIKTTGEALENKRLVGLYFSAAWCGPCRSFSPLLAEMYETLQASFPTHGLEIVFVSSDRDRLSFQNYFAKMPWSSIPFDNLQFVKGNLSTRYGVRGIPTFVIVDTVSGQTVVPGNTSRKEVMEACQRGDTAIENLFQDWLERLPAETKEIMTMLEVSCTDDRVETSASDGNEEITRYLSQPSSDVPLPLRFESVPPLSSDEWEMVCIDRVLDHGSSEDMRQVVETALKYLKNAKERPWMYKFRTFRLSNKVADRITSVPYGINFLQQLGFEVLPTDGDFIMGIPLARDLDELHEELEAYLEEYTQE